MNFLRLFCFLTILFSNHFVFSQEIEKFALEGKEGKHLYSNEDTHYFKTYKDVPLIEMVSNGKNVKSIELWKERGEQNIYTVFYKDEIINVVIGNDQKNEHLIRIDKYNLELEKIDSDEIYVEEKSSKSNNFENCYYSESGLIFINSNEYVKHVQIKSLHYSFSEDATELNTLIFPTNDGLGINDIDIDENLNISILYQSYIPVYSTKPSEFISSRASKDPHGIEAFAVVSSYDYGIMFKKLTKEGDIYNRSFAACFSKEKLLISNLVFDKQTNILSAYTIKTHEIENDLNVLEKITITHKDFATESAWGPFLKENIKQTVRSKKRTKLARFCDLAIFDVNIDDEGYLLLKIIEKTPEVGGSYYPIDFNCIGCQTFYYRPQLLQIDLDLQKINWWNVIVGYASKSPAGNIELAKETKDEYFFFLDVLLYSSFDANNNFLYPKNISTTALKTRSGKVYSTMMISKKTGACRIKAVKTPEGDFLKAKIGYNLSFISNDNYYIKLYLGRRQKELKEVMFYKYKL